MKIYLGIDIGGTAIKYALMNEEALLSNKGEISTPKESLDQFYQALDSIILPYKEQIVGIAISMPGRINHKDGFVYTAGALSNYIYNLPLKDLLEQRYQLKVAIENDGKSAALAELWKGNLKDVESGVVLILGTGIGGGIILDKKLYRGIHSAAGEFSVISANYQSHGFDSFWASCNGVYGLLAPYAQVKQLDMSEVNGKVFFEALHQGDMQAKNILDQYIKTLISGIISIQAILDIEKVCIGGGISQQDILIDSIRKALDDYFEVHDHKLPFIQPKIEKCYYRSDANLVGALKNFFDCQHI